jgi:adenine deaminase
MQMRPESTYTEARTERLPVRDGAIDWGRSDLCLAAVFERHGRAGTVGYGLVRRALTTLGFTHASPIMALGVLTLPVSPELKLTDRGLVDVKGGVIVPLIVED